MRNCLLLFILLFACNNKHEIQNKNVPAATPLLTLADLKYPIIDEDNDITALLPNPYKQNLIKNHIAKRIRIAKLGNINSYNYKVLQQYKREVTAGKLNFHDWLIRKFALSDTNFYDEKGNNIRYNKKPVLEGTNLNYEYDSLGFLTKIFGGLRVDDTIINVFDPTKKILYKIVWDNNRQKTKTNASLMDLLASITTRYYFDSAGFIIKIVHRWKDCSQMQHFEYNAQNQIILLHNRLCTKKGSEIDKLTGPEYSICPIPNESTSKYYYHADSLDSIITFNVFYKNPQYNYTRKTYFDRTGLPSKTVNQNPHFLIPATKIYKYQA